MLKVGLTPLEALAKFYDGEELGVWEGDFIRNKKRRGLELPAMLKEFLGKYAYLDVNGGDDQLWMPDKIDFDTAKVDGETKDILIIGALRGNLVAFLKEDCGQENPWLLLDDLPEESGEELTLVFHKSKEIDLREMLTILLLESPAAYNSSLACNNHEEILKAIQEYGGKAAAELSKLMEGGARPSRTLCWDDEKKEFVALLLFPEREVLLKFVPSFSPRELEGILNRELYENTRGCNYEHALKIVLMLIAFLEKHGGGLLLGEKYAVAGRGNWALKKWNEADEWYKKAERVFMTEMRETLERCQNFYEGLGNFCLAKEDLFRSQAANREADRICEFLGSGGPRARGNRLLRQAAVMLEIERIEKAIEYYDEALKTFQEDPKDCKYEIARCQQLRGEAKKKLKLAQAK